MALTFRVASVIGDANIWHTNVPETPFTFVELRRARPAVGVATACGADTLCLTLAIGDTLGFYIAWPKRVLSAWPVFRIRALHAETCICTNAAHWIYHRIARGLYIRRRVCTAAATFPSVVVTPVRGVGGCTHT